MRANVAVKLPAARVKPLRYQRDGVLEVAITPQEYGNSRALPIVPKLDRAAHDR